MEIVLNQKLLKLLREYSGKKCFADQDFIQRALNIILDVRKNSGAVQDIVIGKNAVLFDDPIFCKDEKTIYVKSEIEKSEITRIFTKEKDIINAYNLRILAYILEICNKIHRKTSKKNDFISYIVYLDDLFKSSTINLCQRMSSIDALEQVDFLAGWLPFDDKKLLEIYLEHEILSTILNGYINEDGILLSPVYRYLSEYNLYLANKGEIVEALDKLKEKIVLSKAKNTLDEDIYLGLPIDEDIYYSLSKQKNETKRVLTKKGN